MFRSCIVQPRNIITISEEVGVLLGDMLDVIRATILLIMCSWFKAAVSSKIKCFYLYVCQLARVGGKDVKDCTQKVLDRYLFTYLLVIFDKTNIFGYWSRTFDCGRLTLLWLSFVTNCFQSEVEREFCQFEVGLSHLSQ